MDSEVKYVDVEIELDGDLWLEIKRVSHAAGITPSQFVEESLRNFVARMQALETGTAEPNDPLSDG